MRQAILLSLILSFSTDILLAQTAALSKAVVSSSTWATNPVIATSTQQNAIAKFENYVFLTYYNADRKLCIARNSDYGEGDASSWKIIELPHTYEQRNGTWDNHNTPNIIVSPNDGRIHLSFDMHARNLRYIISDENAAIVNEASFVPGLFSETRDYLEVSQTAIQRVTYPRFFVGANDQLFFMYRNGGSGNGDTYLVKYKDNGYWNKPVKIIDGKTGSYDGHGDRCAYFNNVHFKDGRIYLTWVWRETPDGATNHDIMFAYSDDDGVTWKNSLGNSVSRPMHLNSTGIKVANIPTNSGLSNHNGASVDGHGNIHVVTRHNGAYLHHFGIKNENKFTWSDQTITTFAGDRPKFYSDQKTNDLYFMVRQGNSLKLWATAPNDEKWDQWSEIKTDSDLYMTSANSFMNADGNLLTSMVVSTSGKLQVLRWALTTTSPEIEIEGGGETPLSTLDADFSVYPNPSPNGYYRLSEVSSYKLYNVSGNLVAQGRGELLDLSDHPKGLYLLHTQDRVIRLSR